MEAVSGLPPTPLLGSSPFPPPSLPTINPILPHQTTFATSITQTLPQPSSSPNPNEEHPIHSALYSQELATLQSRLGWSDRARRVLRDGLPSALEKSNIKSIYSRTEWNKWKTEMQEKRRQEERRAGIIGIRSVMGEVKDKSKLRICKFLGSRRMNRWRRGELKRKRIEKGGDEEGDWVSQMALPIPLSAFEQDIEEIDTLPISQSHLSTLAPSELEPIIENEKTTHRRPTVRTIYPTEHSTPTFPLVSTYPLMKRPRTREAKDLTPLRTCGPSPTYCQELDVLRFRARRHISSRKLLSSDGLGGLNKILGRVRRGRNSGVEKRVGRKWGGRFGKVGWMVWRVDDKWVGRSESDLRWELGERLRLGNYSGEDDGNDDSERNQDIEIDGNNRTEGIDREFKKSDGNVKGQEYEKHENYGKNETSIENGENKLNQKSNNQESSTESTSATLLTNTPSPTSPKKGNLPPPNA